MAADEDNTDDDTGGDGMVGVDDRQGWALGVPLDRPSIARIYDWFLDGSHNFEIDRAVARRILELMPEARLMSRLNRAFLRRAVRFCAGRGVRQFLDLGSGLPTIGNVHEIAHGIDPAARVVYVDNDDITVTHTRQLLTDAANVAVVHADLRNPATVLDSPQVRGMVDFDLPVAILAVAVLHFVPDAEDPAAIIDTYCSAVSSGSMLAVVHSSTDAQEPAGEHVRAASTAYNQLVTTVTPRSHAQVAALFTGFDLVEPGLTWLHQWRPEPGEPTESAPAAAIPHTAYAGVAIKP